MLHSTNQTFTDCLIAQLAKC